MLKNLLLIFTFAYLSALTTNAQDKPQNIMIDLPEREWTVESFINFLKDNYQFMFSYVSAEIPLDSEIVLKPGKLSLYPLLNSVCSQAGIKYSYIEKQFILSRKEKTEEKYTINGIITDALTGENLIGASIYIDSRGVGTCSNSYGFYSITLPAENIAIEFSFIGYISQQKLIALDSGITANVQLMPKTTSINEVIITGTHAVPNTFNSTLTGYHRLAAKEVKKIAGIGGQPDVLKSLQLFPGIVPLNDGIALYSVRGGSSDQNLYLLDEAPVYNPSHVLGFLSVFNPDAVHSVDIMKGHIPARFGGRLSSVADIRLKGGNRNNFSMTAYLDPFSGGLTAESPVRSEKTSFLVSGRYFNLTPVSKLAEALREIVYLPGMNNFDEYNRIHFYDANIKINHRTANNNQFFFSAYTGHDGFYFAQIDDRSRQNWGNTTATLRWNHIAGEKLFYNITALYSRYNYSFNLSDGAYRYNWVADMNQGEIKADIDYYANPANHFEFGAKISFLNILPGKIIPADTGSFASGFSMQHRYAIEPAIYLSNKQNIGEKLLIEYGLRISPIVSYRKITDTTSMPVKNNYKCYIYPEPRISLRYFLSRNISFKASYDRLTQALHLLSNAIVGMPTDIWIPSDKIIKPQISNQFSTGFYFLLNKNRLEASAEAYYRSVDHIVDYKDNASIRLNEFIDDEILTGNGRSYGLECMIRKSTGKLSGLISYTISKTEQKIGQINENRYYPSKYDHRHNLSAFVSQSIGRRLSISSTFIYRTGNAVTVPVGTFTFKRGEYNIYTERNGYRMPDYNRIDITIGFGNNPVKKFRSEWSLSIYNLYGRRNAFAYYNGKKIYLPGAIPVIRYSCKF